MQDRYFTDEELVAYLDGETDLAPVGEIERALETDAALVQRLDALHIDVAAISQSFAEIGPSDTAFPDLSETLVTPQRAKPQLMALAAGVALVVGIAVGSWMSTPTKGGWTDYVAAYQVLYSNSTLAHIDQTEAEKQTELERVAASIGKTIPLDALEGFPEIEYKRAQVLSFEGRALLQLAFTTSTGEPLALCIIRKDDGVQDGPQIANMEGLSTATWANGNYEYLLIGGTDDALVSRIANEFVSLSL